MKHVEELEIWNTADRMQIDTITLENSMAISCKFKHNFSVWSSIPLLGIGKRNENMSMQRLTLEYL